MTKLIGAGLLALSASRAEVSVKLTPSIQSGAPVGSTIEWAAKASDTTNPSANFVYQFSVGPAGAPLQIRRDFYKFDSFPWTPADAEGTYNIQVTARSSSGASGTGRAVYTVTSRVGSGSPVVSKTRHPLVALYSMPACSAGLKAQVRFKLPGDTDWQTTPPKVCNGTTSLNFYVAGMRPATTYQLKHDVLTDSGSTSGPVLNFTTGTLPAKLPIK